MEVMVATAIGVLTAAAVYLLMRPTTFSVVLGLSLLSHAANLFIFSMGRLTIGLTPIVDRGEGQIPDPLPQALVLTAIVINFAMTAFLVTLALRARLQLGTDHIGGRVPEPGPDGDDHGGRHHKDDRHR